MPRLHYLQTNFSGGEVSPRFVGRPDVRRYFNAVATLENYLVHPLGGVYRRAGTRFVAEVKNSLRVTRLIPFEFSKTTAYVLEVGQEYIRFYKSGARIEVAGVPVEVATPYQVSHLYDLDFRQSADVVYVLHPEFDTYRLERYGDALWRFRVVDFTPPPSFEFGARPVATVTPSAIGGTGVTFTASVDAFLASDVGREILITGGTNAGARVTITAFTSRTVVTGTVTEEFVDVSANAAGNWKLTDSPKTTATISAKSPVGAAVTVTLAAEGFRGLTGLGDSDCGHFVMVNQGSFEITSISSRTVANALIRGEAVDTAVGQSGVWTLEEALWSTANGFPEAGAFFEDRFWLGAGHRFAGSKSGDYENFGIGALDDDAVVFAISADQVNAIRWMVGARSLLLGTTGGEYVATGGPDAVITPSNVQVKAETTYGSSGVSPLKTSNIVLFLTPSQRELRELVFNFEVDGFVAPDLLLIAEHLTESNSIVELAQERDRQSIIWAVRDDGVLLACTYLRDQEIVGWSRQVTQGVIESVATIPHPSGGKDQTWWLVRRTINGATRRYVEYLDDTGVFYSQLNTDSTITGVAGPYATVTGLGHLENMTVKIVGDGAVYPDQVVSGGQITLDPAPTKVEVGLGYTSTLTTLRPEVASGSGSTQPVKLRWAEIMVRLYRSLGMTINGDQLPFRMPGDPMDSAPPLFTGEKRVQNLGYDDNGQVTIQQMQPLPSEVLMLSGTLDLGGG